MKNVNKVPKRQWKRWTKVGQRVFNRMYKVMRLNQCLFLHPDTDPVPAKRWKTTCWNVAWYAADEADYAAARESSK